MLRMPQSASNVATLIGIDPGSSKMGICIMEYNVDTLELLSTNAFTIVGEKLIAKNSFLAMVHGDRFARIEGIGLRLYDLFVRHNPTYVASESPFFNPSRPNAFEVLIEVIMKIRQALWRYDPWIELYRIDPPTVKAGVGVMKVPKGEKAKTVVRDAVLALASELRYIGTTPLHLLDDNAIDSIAVAKTRLEILRGKLCHKPRR